MRRAWAPRDDRGGDDGGQSEDAALPVWAGRVPLRLVAGTPVPCQRLGPGIATPDDIANYAR